VIINNHPFRQDPVFAGTHRINCCPETFAKTLIKRVIKNPSRILKSILTLEESAIKLLRILLQKDTFTEPQAVKTVLSRLNNQGLFIGNSLPVRDAAAVIMGEVSNTVITGNRGINGIDGTLASGAGFAKGLNKRTTIIIGDMAFLHDLNSLILIKQSLCPICVLLINNQGGAIFSFLPQLKKIPKFKKYFESRPLFDFEAASASFGLNYINPKTKKTLVQSLMEFNKGNKSVIIEIKTTSKVTREWFFKYWKSVEKK